MLSAICRLLPAIFPPDTEWRHATPIWRVRLIDGTLSDGHVMFRRVRGQIQYRRATEEEACEHFDMLAW